MGLSTPQNGLSSAHILHDFDPSLPVVGTDASDYTITGILSVRTEDGQVHPLAFFTRTLSGAELNYDTHNKELLAIFEAFKTWRYYLESRHHRIDVITDHKNPEYFSSTEIPMRRQASWSGFHSAFNMAIRLRPGTLGEKPDSHTWRADFYLTRGDRVYTLASLQNLRPIFTQEQLATSFRATQLHDVAMDLAALVDCSVPILDISAGLAVDPLSSWELDICLKGSPSPRFSLSLFGYC